MKDHKEKNKNKEDVKEKVSEVVGKFSKLLEETAHSLIDTGARAKEKIGYAFKIAQEELEDVMDFINNDTLKVEELQDGDLVISPVDVKIPVDNANIELYPDGVLHKKGEIFEYNEERDSPFIQRLLKPSTKQASNYGAINELRNLLKETSAAGTRPYIYKRIDELKNEK